MLAAKGDPETSVRAPVPEFIEKTEIELEEKFDTNIKSPAAVIAKEDGESPTGVRGRTSESAPELPSI
jgi:hypothetical protein